MPTALVPRRARRLARHHGLRAGPLHALLPGGTCSPWAERARAPVRRRVVTVGITGAVLAGGKSRAQDERRPTARIDLPYGLADGEVALGDLLDGSPTTAGRWPPIRLPAGAAGARRRACPPPPNRRTATVAATRSPDAAAPSGQTPAPDPCPPRRRPPVRHPPDPPTAGTAPWTRRSASAPATAPASSCSARWRAATRPPAPRRGRRHAAGPQSSPPAAPLGL